MSEESDNSTAEDSPKAGMSAAPHAEDVAREAHHGSNASVEQYDDSATYASKRVKLEINVRDALAALPAHFATQTFIEGLEAGDLFSLNSMLGGNIEIQMVQTLNRLRAVWDPDEEWDEYRFVRSAQTFPDVRLQTETPSRVALGQGVAIGIELKGWYLLSKEGEPSFRYTVTRNACDERDLLCVVPWHLANVLSGKPVVYVPFVTSAQEAADDRNHYWAISRKAKAEGAAAKALGLGRKPKTYAADYYDIQAPSGRDVHAYPPPKAKVSDKAKHDSGSNFGRVARTKGMQGYVNENLMARVSGIEARHWVAFFKTYAEGSSTAELHQKVLRRLAQDRIDTGGDDEALKGLLTTWARLQGDED